MIIIDGESTECKIQKYSDYELRRIDFFLFTGKAIYLDTQTISLINTCIRTIKLNLSVFIENV